MAIQSTSIKEFIRQHANDDVNKLALKASKFPDIDLPYAIQQIAGRKAIAEKVPTWHAVDDLLFPRHISLEQCSSEITAQYKASLTKGETLVDLTGGFGIDCAFMAESFKRVTYVDRNADLCEIAKHNFSLLQLQHIMVVNDEASHFLEKIENVACIFIDPARRNGHGAKTVAISDCEPDVEFLAPQLLAKAKQVIIKLSPMLDLTLALQALLQTTALHIVSVNNECKELILILENRLVENIPITCINFTKQDIQTFIFSKQEEQACTSDYTSELDDYLYEPNASIMKGGAYKSLAIRFKMKKLHSNSHLYTSTERIENFPGRIFKIKSIFSMNKNELKQSLDGIKQANITVRNFPSSVADLRKRLKLNEGGSTYLFATTLADERKVLVKCVKG